MNKLSSCELFQMVDRGFKGHIVKNIAKISKNIEAYLIDPTLYSYIINRIKIYKYPLSKMIVKSASSLEIRPILLSDPKNPKDEHLYLPAALNVISNSAGTKGYVDISSKGAYKRDKAKTIEALDIKEIDLYAMLQYSFIDINLKRYANVIDSSGKFIKNTIQAYSRLFSRCIDRNFPLSSNPMSFQISIFLSGVYALVTFFNKSIESAIKIMYSSKISNPDDIENSCKVLMEGKLEFKTLTEFLTLFNYEFSDYMKKDSLNPRMMVNIWQKMYGVNSYFAIEHATSFINMVLSVNIGLYNYKLISKTIKKQTDTMMTELAHIVSKSY